MGSTRARKSFGQDAQKFTARTVGNMEPGPQQVTFIFLRICQRCRECIKRTVLGLEPDLWLIGEKMEGFGVRQAG